MQVLLKLLPIYVVMLAAQLVFGWFNYTFLFSRMKSGIYHLPVVDQTFASWWKFAIAAWAFNAPAYIIGTILVALSVKLSVESFGVMYTSIIVGQVITVITTLFFMWYKIGELPNRNGWIALALVLLASIFSAYSGKNV